MTRYLSGSRSFNLNGDFIAPIQNSLSSAINGDCRPDLAQCVNVSKDAVSANTVFNLIVLKIEFLSLETLKVLCASRRTRLPSVYMCKLSLTTSNSPRRFLPCVRCSDDKLRLGIYYYREGINFINYCIIFHPARKIKTCSHANKTNTVAMNVNLKSCIIEIGIPQMNDIYIYTRPPLNIKYIMRAFLEKKLRRVPK